jgi:hypothetical protein
MQILFLSTRAAKPSYRFRVEQMLPCFRERGHLVETCFLPKTAWGRWSVYRRLPRYDVVFLQKRLLSWAELKIVRQRARRLVFDIDDAVMCDDEGHHDSRRHNRFQAICRTADLVVCGNAYLEEQASVAGGRTSLVPTAIDAARFHPGLRNRENKDRAKLLTIGWTGSRSTNAYLNFVFPAIANFAGRVQVKVISDTAAASTFRCSGTCRTDSCRGRPTTKRAKPPRSTSVSCRSPTTPGRAASAASRRCNTWRWVFRRCAVR